MTPIDKEALKSALVELIREEPAMIRSLLKDVLNEHKEQNALATPVSNEEFDQYTQQNFKRFDATFRALA